MALNKESVIYYIKNICIFIIWFIIGFIGINILLSLGD
jgi:hypothetical protein